MEGVAVYYPCALLVLTSPDLISLVLLHRYVKLHLG